MTNKKILITAALVTFGFYLFNRGDWSAPREFSDFLAALIIGVVFTALPLFVARALWRKVCKALQAYELNARYKAYMPLVRKNDTSKEGER